MELQRVNVVKSKIIEDWKVAMAEEWNDQPCQVLSF